MRRYVPVLTLCVLAPLIAEVLFGATTISQIGGLLVTAPLYGGGAILIRELARRRGTGWARIALLGAAYGIIEEGLAIQSLFNPDLFNAGQLGARWLGVNWVWTEWTIGYHIVWSIALPILLAEMLFPARRNSPWLGRVGIASAAVLYAFGAIGVGVVFRFVVTPDFRAPLPLLVGAAAVAALLVAFALLWPGHAPIAATASRNGAPSPWIAGLSVLIAAIAWFALLGLPEQLKSGALVLVPMLGAAALALAVAALLRRWSTAPGWDDLHRLAAAVGALLVSMAFGFFAVTAGNPLNQFAQGMLSLFALALLGVWILRLRRSSAAHERFATISK